MPDTFIKIASVTVGSGGASSVTFSSIAQTYTDLAILACVRWTGSNSLSQSLGAYFNGDPFPAAVTTRGLKGSGSAASSYTGSGFVDFGYMDDATATANVFSSHSIYIPNYTSNQYKSISADAVNETNATAANSTLVANLYSSTAAITSIKFDIPSSLYAQYSTFTLYGINKS